MKILFTMHAVSDANAGVAGATFRLAEALRHRGHHVDIMSFDDFKCKTSIKSFIFPWLVAWRLRTRRGSYDVIDMTSGDGWVHCVLRKLTRRDAKVVIVFRSHGLEHTAHQAVVQNAQAGRRQLSWKYPLYHGGFRLWECATAARQSDVAMFLNKFDLSFAVNHLRVDPARAVLIRNGISPRIVEQAERTREVLPPAPSGHRIAFIGSFGERKGSTPFREAMIKVMMLHPKVEVGYFGCLTGREIVVADYPAEYHHRISVTPIFENESLPMRLSGYAILAFPSLSEGFPLAPLEAMACGLVPVVSAIPGATEYVSDGENGLCFPPSDVTLLAGCIIRLINDDKLLQRLSYGAVQTARRYSWNMIAIEAEETYRRAQSKTKSSPAPLSALTAGG